MEFRHPAKVRALVSALAAAGLASFAGTAAAQAEQRITITGSSIKRIAAEGALPLQVITRAELDRQGIVSAEQVIATLTFNGNGLDNLASNADVVSGQARGNNGASSANLRNQGANATLILLNGRRIAAHGLNGGVVDLNQIPMAAVERIEVLKDGASSTYGTDAVGGVINFILRTNFSGVQASATADVTEAGGGNIYRAALVGGFGNFASDGWNVLATLALTDHKKLAGSERDFVNTFQPERGLSPDTRGTPFGTVFAVNTTAPNLMTRPGGAGTPAANGTAPILDGIITNGINVLDLPGAAGCASQPDMGPYDQLIWAAGAGARYGCAWDTGKAAVIQQPVRNTNLVTRGSFKLSEQHTLIGEVLLGRSESTKSFSENQITTSSTTANITLGNGTVVPSPFRDLVYPSTGAGYDRVANALVGAFPALAGNLGNSIAFRWRCMACGPREIDTETDTSRFLVGLEGALPWLPGFDYRLGVSRASSESKSTLGSGYHYMLGFANLIKNGTLNPFLIAGEQQTPAAMAALESVSARGVELYDGTFTMTQLDAVASGPVAKLPAGDVLVAAGVDLRTEKYKFDGNNTAGFSSIDTWVFNAPFDNVNALGGVKRDVKAVFGEVIVPVLKTLEVNLSARHDNYTGFGSTTNPKASFRFQPLAELVARGSYGTGFRVPTFNQLYNGVTESVAPGAGNVDPERCPSLTVDPTPGSPCNAITFDTLFGGKPDLGPEKSKMTSLGFVWQPAQQFSASVDWWDIKREGTIQSFSLATFMANYALFRDRFIRDGSGNITDVDTRWVNAGETVTKGIDVSLRGGDQFGPGRVSAGIDISYLLEKKSRLLTSSPFGPSEVARFTRADDLGIRWKHHAFVTYRQGAWSGTLSQLYRSGYAGYVPPGVANGSVTPSEWDPVVKPYRIYNLAATYTGVPNLALTLGVKNLFDTDPPFANSYDTNTGSGSSWEPRVADPRGRSYVLTVEYKFF
ncbi:MAG: TonB-dependent receptor [Rubrivivax sp.]|nr:TonB-dependent receptor [Rubrivivax sp.]